MNVAGVNNVNSVIDRIVRDRSFAQRIQAQGESALREFELSSHQVRVIIGAVRESPSLESLREIAHFEPLFAAYSGATTKKG